MGIPADQASFLQATLGTARKGGATLTRLAEAHEIATRYHLHSTITELRKHIRALVPEPDNGSVRTANSLLVGMAGGIVTHFALKATSR